MKATVLIEFLITILVGFPYFQFASTSLFGNISQNCQFCEYICKCYFPDDVSISSDEVNSSSVGNSIISEAVCCGSRLCTSRNAVYKIAEIISILSEIARRLNLRVVSFVSPQSFAILGYLLPILVISCSDYLSKLCTCDIRRNESEIPIFRFVNDHVERLAGSRDRCHYFVSSLLSRRVLLRIILLEQGFFS